jgi:hypothetical protein
MPVVRVRSTTTDLKPALTTSNPGMYHRGVPASRERHRRIIRYTPWWCANEARYRQRVHIASLDQQRCRPTSFCADRASTCHNSVPFECVVWTASSSRRSLSASGTDP